MTERNLFDAITDTPDNMIDEAGSIRLKKRVIPWRAIVAVAACLAVVIGGMYIFRPDHPYIPPISTDTIGGTASLTPLVNVVYPEAYGYHTILGPIYEANPVEESFLEAVNTFSYQTASELLSDTTGNQNYSPLSLYYALAIAATGANGETATQLYDLLGVDSREELSVQCGNLYRRLYKDNEIGQLKIANSLWMNKDVSFYKEFVDNAADQFYASSYSVDFSDEATGKAMGQWIADNTNGTLAPIIKADPEILLSILNTVYFYDEWQNAFLEENTKPDTFYLSNGNTITCEFMNAHLNSSYFQGDGFTRSTLSLKNHFKMVFILPDEGETPQDLLSSPDKVEELFPVAKLDSNGYLTEDDAHGIITWKIPKFKFSSSYDELIGTLKDLGVTSPFEDADFSAMTNQAAFISKIKQETTIGIDEKGVEASAYTKVDLSLGGGPIPLNASMILDRPFIFGIQSQDGTLLFVGICENPTAK